MKIQSVADLLRKYEQDRENTETMIAVCKVLTELPGNSIEDVELLSAIIAKYSDFANWSKSTELNARAFIAYCKLFSDALLRTGQALNVDTLPILNWFNLARAEVEDGLAVHPTSEESAKVRTAWAQLRFAARIRADSEVEPKQPGQSQQGERALTDNDIGLLESMNAMQLSVDNVASREAILRHAKWTAEGKHAFDRLKAAGYVASKQGVGYFLTAKGIAKANSLFNGART